MNRQRAQPPRDSLRPGRGVGFRVVLVALLLIVSAFVRATAAAGEALALPLVAPLSNGEVLPLPEVDPAIPSPASFLGRSLGSRFTHASEIGAYLERLAQVSPRVAVWSYGETYEGRPLKLAAISSRENIERLQDLRQRHLRLASPASLETAELEALTFTQPVVIWLAYGVHGNESSSSEAAMATAYLLAAGTGEWEAMLREVVVILDPISNPDGRERYVGFYEQRRGSRPDASRQSAEHEEPWPGGRTNHYWIDLNRDWAWATQQETLLRLAAYRQWEPVVYADFHEMGGEATYYFPPPAPPFHPVVPDRTAVWFQTFAKATAAAFDRLGWLFFNRERYDLFYPGYGDSYPSLRGAVGMTYEMAGGGSAGQLLERRDGSTLSLADRIGRHLMSSLAAVRTAAQNRVSLLKDFVASRRAWSVRLPRSFVWEAQQGESEAMALLLQAHGIRVQQLPADTDLAVSSLAGGKPETRHFPAGTLVVSTAQPLGGLAESLLAYDSPLPEEVLERERRLAVDAEPLDLYDITAWALPLAYHVECWQMLGEPRGLGAYLPRTGRTSGEAQVGHLIAPQGLASYRVAAALAREKIPYRFAQAPFEIAGRKYPTGTLFIPRLSAGERLETAVLRVARQEGVDVEGASSSATASGISLGSSDFPAVRPARVALVIGQGVAATSAGAIWHLLDRDLALPLRLVNLSSLAHSDWGFEVLILPDGKGYKDQLGEAGAQALERWIRQGGVVVAVGDAFAYLADLKLAEVSRWKPPAVKPDTATETTAAATLAQRTVEVPGAILATAFRDNHPLAAGLSSPPAVLFQGEDIYLATGSPEHDLWWVRHEKPTLLGLVFPEVEPRLAGSLLAYERRLEAGKIIGFTQDPIFRLFWRGSMPLFLNAVMFAPSW
ncbi:MAG: M14 family zinc carboxypeptidase [Thermoanaerobaculia bacterium]